MVSFLRVSLLAATACLASLLGQTTFDVVSVKPSIGESPVADIIPRRSGARVFMHHAALESIVSWAYELSNKNYQLAGGRWEKLLWEDYDIDALTAAPMTDAELRPIFKKLLETRFGLKVHKELRELPAYDLVVAKSGSRLVAAEPGPRRTLGFGGSSSWVEITDHGLLLQGRGASLAELVVVLSGQMQSPVRDETGISGNFDYSILFRRDLESSETPFLPEAIRALGLDLRKSKGSFDVLVVDYLEKPSQN